MLQAIGIGLGAAGWIVAFVGWRQLYRWERQLRGVRIQVTFKGKPKMNPRLIDWLRWGLTLQGDKRINGQVVYGQGGTTIALLKPQPRSHGKTKTKTVAPQKGASNIKELRR